MNRQARKSIGVTLLLAASLLAVLFAFGLFSPWESGAHPCAPGLTGDMHEDFNRTVLECDEPGHQNPHQNVIEVNGGRDRELKFKAYPPPSDRDSYLDAGDRIVIALPEFELAGADSNGLEDKISIAGSKDGSTDTPVTPTGADVSGNNLILTLPNLSDPARFEAGEYLDITIGKGSGILTPEVPRGFDNQDLGYPVTITFADGDSTGNGKADFVATDRNIVVVKNPISSTVPSATVRVELATHAEAPIGSAQEITVDFSGPSADSEFVVPSSISTSRITIEPDGETPFNPSEVQVQGAKVILVIPSGTAPRSVAAGDYTITFTNSANIRNPFSAGNKVITVSSSAEGDQPDRITAVIRRTTTIGPLEGPRGSEFTLEGRGYAKGTVTIFEGDDGNIDPGETLASVNTNRGAFSVKLTVRGRKGDLVYRVWTRDSYGVVRSIDFAIKSAILFEPPKSSVGSRLKISIVDWQDPRRDVAAVRIGGRLAYITGVIEHDRCFEYTGLYRADSDGLVSLEVTVPEGVPRGEQTVSMYDHEQLEHYVRDADGREVIVRKSPCLGLGNNQSPGGVVAGSEVLTRIKGTPNAIAAQTILIEREDLTLTPDTAARWQRVTITGSGFSRSARNGNHIESVWIGGKRVPENHLEFGVGTDGDFALTVTVPLEVKDGPNEVLIEGADDTIGQATLTVPGAAITLTPAQGQRGTDLGVAGGGFIAREFVKVTYGPEEGSSGEAVPLAASGAVADYNGNFNLTLTVPIPAVVGRSYKVTAVAAADAMGNTVTVDAEVSHLVTKAIITTSPESVSPGDSLTIQGKRFPPFSLVGAIRIGGIEVVPGAEVATDENGSFEAKALVPHIDYGDQVVQIQVGGVIVPHVIELVTPPLTGPPDQVFKYLIQSGSLSAVWHYDNATQTWGLFDPQISEDVAELNDLEKVASGDIVWVNLRRPDDFQGDRLDAGWSLINLD